MKTTINYFSRVLCALLLCAGLVVTSCVEGLLENGGTTGNIQSSGSGNNGSANNLNGNNEDMDGVDPVTLEIGIVKAFSVSFNGCVNIPVSELSSICILYSDAEQFDVRTAERLSITSFDSDRNFKVTLTNLESLTKYNYCIYVKTKSSEETYSEIQSFTTVGVTDLSSAASANCYVISEFGVYKFKPLKGNSNTAVGRIATAEILWESFGTDVTPLPNDLVCGVSYDDGYIIFETNEIFKKGNAVIAAKDVSGNILWSWHIWLTDQLQEQVYFNDAGTMMDRNLGAISATPGDVGALGLLYQWGRKDPFLGSSSIYGSQLAKSTGDWPSIEASDMSNGTVEYSIANPMTFITCNLNNYDWIYSSDKTVDNTRWPETKNSKSIYDPCPAGWRVPDGGSEGVWVESEFRDALYDTTNEGISFEISSPSTTWYPTSGFRCGNSDGGLYSVGINGYFWSASPCDISVYGLRYGNNGLVFTNEHFDRSYGFSIRCSKEQFSSPDDR